MDSRDYRRGLLAKVHIARKDLGLTEEEYRATLREMFGIESAAQLTEEQLGDLVEHFLHRGWRGPQDLSDRPGYLEIADSDPYARQKRYILALARRLGWRPGVLQRYMRAKVRSSSLAHLHDPTKLNLLARDLWGRCVRQGIDPGAKGEPKPPERPDEPAEGAGGEGSESGTRRRPQRKARDKS
ncbi:Protein of unknown function (DUF1018) [Desulfocurvibacter africanus PCS]|uniref:Mu-like prophage protein gp16 n=1 Tax=Desulfocurvibacter africanus PCS TaxID=1262666 RepID=M5Q161_DESAF|nr:phage protein GemA/Gp16 family protein [Desulfocurvibacter africanus]EMG36273.1 Protein of unknown function (DUF1018) [Desulfocurvibacter africanus PCS]